MRFTNTNLQTAELRNAVLSSLENTSSAQFAHIRYRNEAGELSVYTLNLNTSFMNMYKDDLETLKNMKTTTEVEAKAKDELIESVEKAIVTEFNHEKSPTKNMISLQKSIKFHPEKNEMYIHAVSLKKKVLESGTYKIVNSSEKTIVKNQLKKSLKQSKLRFFRINLEQIKAITTNNKRIVIVAG